MPNKVIDAYDAALSLMASSTTGWTWAMAVEQMAIVFDLNTAEASQVLNAQQDVVL